MTRHIPPLPSLLPVPKPTLPSSQLRSGSCLAFFSQFFKTETPYAYLHSGPHPFPSGWCCCLQPHIQSFDQLTRTYRPQTESLDKTRGPLHTLGSFAAHFSKLPKSKFGSTRPPCCTLSLGAVNLPLFGVLFFVMPPRPPTWNLPPFPPRRFPPNKSVRRQSEISLFVSFFV